MTAVVLLLSWLVIMQGGAAAHPTSELVGRWTGSSVCTKADWNAACHDEEALYDFQEGVAPGHVLSKGYKMVNGKPEYMGDLDFAYDETAKAWVAEFSGTSVQSRWIFEPHGDDLRGRAVLLPSMRVGRTIHVTRQPSR
jgi:hypothetical protein